MTKSNGKRFRIAKTTAEIRRTNPVVFREPVIMTNDVVLPGQRPWFALSELGFDDAATDGPKTILKTFRQTVQKEAKRRGMTFDTRDGVLCLDCRDAYILAIHRRKVPADLHEQTRVWMATGLRPKGWVLDPWVDPQPSLFASITADVESLRSDLARANVRIDRLDNAFQANATMLTQALTFLTFLVREWFGKDHRKEADKFIAEVQAGRVTL